MTAAFAVGNTVTIAAPGAWFGHTGIITDTFPSDNTDLWLYRVSETTMWVFFYADELSTPEVDL